MFVLLVVVSPFPWHFIPDYPRFVNTHQLCRNLTDASFKVIAEMCPGLLSLDIVNLIKLSDAAIGHLANGCRGIRKLVLRRNTFRYHD